MTLSRRHQQILGLDGRSRNSNGGRRKVHELTILRDVNPLDGELELGEASAILGAGAVNGGVEGLVHGDKHNGAVGLAVLVRATTTNGLAVEEDDTLQSDLGARTTRAALLSDGGFNGGGGGGFGDVLHGLFLFVDFLLLEVC